MQRLWVEKIFICAMIMFGLSWGGLRADDAFGAEEISVAVSVLPQAYFVERIGGVRVAVQVMIPKYASPETYESTPRQLVKLSNSRIYVKVGSPGFSFENKYFDSFLKQNEHMMVVNMSRGVAYRQADEHRHGEATEEKEKVDPHVWVAPATVKIAAENICQALASYDPASREYYRANLQAFLKDIDALDLDIKQILSGKEGFAFMVFHPAWGYFADQYGLKQLAIEWEGKSPSAYQLKDLIDTARQKSLNVIFVQKGFDAKAARMIAAEIGGEVAAVDPLEKDWLRNMREVALTFSRALRQ